MLEKHGERFLERALTRGGRAQRGRSAGLHLAGRFAAKEAVLKALGTGWAEGVGWRDIEVVALPSGAPTLRLTGHAATLASQRGITAWHISISHTDQHAMASVIAAGE
jgi:holo-[acyl-carrier protein] synthase